MSRRPLHTSLSQTIFWMNAKAQNCVSDHDFLNLIGSNKVAEKFQLLNHGVKVFTNRFRQSKFVQLNIRLKYCSVNKIPLDTTFTTPNHRVGFKEPTLIDRIHVDHLLQNERNICEEGEKL